MYKKEFGKNIKKFRKYNDLSQQALGEMLNTTKQNISSWEHDRTQPSNNDLHRMAEIFNCEVSQITGDDFEEIIDFIRNSPPSMQNMMKNKYLSKETEFVAEAYYNAPDYIKESVCKLLDVNREMFNVDRFIEDN